MKINFNHRLSMRAEDRGENLATHSHVIYKTELLK
jgi:hypothetical protein